MTVTGVSQLMSHVSLSSSAHQAGAWRQASEAISVIADARLAGLFSPLCYFSALAERERTKDKQPCLISKRRQRHDAFMLCWRRQGRPTVGKKNKDLLQNKPSCAPKNVVLETDVRSNLEGVGLGPAVLCASLPLDLFSLYSWILCFSKDCRSLCWYKLLPFLPSLAQIYEDYCVFV